MDGRLVTWVRQVKARRVGSGKRGLRVPPLWLFTDAVRAPDPLPAIARLPRGLAGVVFRHDGVSGRAALARQVAALCRARRLALVVAGDPRLAAAVGAGVHLRGGRGRPGRLPPGRFATSSAHGRAELVRAMRAGVDAVFLSPLFPTASHPGGRVLGPVRWAGLARGCGRPVLALGGVQGGTVRRVPRGACGAGLIGAVAAL